MKYVLTLSLLFVFSCTSIPRNAAFLAENVNAGIVRMSEENAKVIHALAEVERAVLNDRWGVMYVTVEDQYRAVKKINLEAPLSQEQRRAVAANVSKVRENILSGIEKKEQTLLIQSNHNRDTIIQMNDAVRRYLVSLDGSQTSKENLARLLKEISGLNVDDLRGLVLQQLNKLRGI